MDEREENKTWHFVEQAQSVSGCLSPVGADSVNDDLVDIS